MDFSQKVTSVKKKTKMDVSNSLPLLPPHSALNLQETKHAERKKFKPACLLKICPPARERTCPHKAAFSPPQLLFSMEREDRWVKISYVFSLQFHVHIWGMSFHHLGEDEISQGLRRNLGPEQGSHIIIGERKDWWKLQSDSKTGHKVRSKWGNKCWGRYIKVTNSHGSF